MHSHLNRRTFLRASGVSIGLPLFGGMTESCVSAEDRTSGTKDVRRMLAICAPLGMHTPNLFPETSGRDYEITSYLKPMEGLRDKFTVISGMMHPNVDGGHAAEKSFLTGAAHPGQPSFQNTISVDQLAAEQIGYKTRFSSLTLAVEFSSLSYTRSGVQIPAERSPANLFSKLFLDGTKQEKERQMRRIEDGQSIMDLVQDQTRKITKKVGREDNRTLDQYLTSVRELEQRLVLAEGWANRAKPHVDRKLPVDYKDRSLLTERLGLMYEMIFLAIQTDSTRLITLMGPGGNEVVHLKGVDDGWHNLSHHGRDPNKIEMLSIIELEEMRLLAELLQKLEDAKEGENSLLDQTAILFGSSLGNASSHNNSNLPILAAGGHFRHGQHLAYGDDAKLRRFAICWLVICNIWA